MIIKIINCNNNIDNQYCQQPQTAMLGSILNSSSISLFDSHLIAAFGPKYYIFDTLNCACLMELDIGHDCPILSSHTQQQRLKYTICSIDCKGNIIKVQLNLENSQMQQQNTGKRYKIVSSHSLGGSKNKKQKTKIRSACFIDNNTVFYVDWNKNLHKFDIQNSAVSHVGTQSTYLRIMSNKNSGYLYAIEQSQTRLKIISIDSKFVKDYEHPNKITSVAELEQMLIIGDERGKITLLYNYLAQGKKQKSQAKSVLEWHTGQVKALCTHGQYLYSAGHESVVVLWHIRDLTRDFLPRVGAPITSLQIKPNTNEVVCSLSDNSVKVIDLSRDKQTKAYKLIVDPKGYAPEDQPRFTALTTCYKEGLVCLNSLPGKLQFINLRKNAQNNELQIIPRNLINSINEDRMSPHRVKSISFSSDWTVLAASVNKAESSYLKFYRKGVLGYQLINKVQNPQSGFVERVWSFNSKNANKFLTYSKEDCKIRIWSEHRQKKKSIVDVSQVFWRCSQQLQFRGQLPSFVSVYKNYILVVFNCCQIVIYKIEQDGAQTEWQKFSVQKILNQAYIVDVEIAKQKKNIKLILVSNQNQLQLINCIQSKGKQMKSNLSQKLNLTNKQSGLLVIEGQKQVAVVLNTIDMGSQILILNRSNNKFTESFNCDAVIESGFWLAQKQKEETFVFVTSQMEISSLDGSNIVNFVQTKPLKSSNRLDMDQQSTQLRNYGQADIFKLSQRWVEKQSIRKRKKVEESIEQLQFLPSCTAAWEHMASRLFI